MRGGENAPKEGEAMTRKFLCALLGASALMSAAAANAESREYQFDLPAQPLGAALKAYGAAADQPIIFAETLMGGRTAPALKGAYTAEEGLSVLLAGTGLVAERTPTGVMAIRSLSQGPQGGSAGGDVDALIVTAQKREENIQDVPIAISAFNQKALDEQKIEGGFDLLKAIPNVTFSKNNFTSYNFSIRGIGTKAISATTDPGVAVAFNSTGLIQNRLFEQEYFDIERVEVLRGPQGTLYGRNATSGVINVISRKADLDAFDGQIKGELGNYDTKRLSGYLNVPLIEDVLALRFAGAMTDRQGYDYNSITKNAVNGRDLWSGRLTLSFEPTERIRGDLIWERFEEDDNRSRTGKQLCHRDPGPSMIGSTPVVHPSSEGVLFQEAMRPALFSQGCRPGSLYDDAAFGTPNGLALPFVFGMITLGADCGPGCATVYELGYDRDSKPQTLVQIADPYGGMMQSRDLRTIASFRDPVYRAKADVIELNVDIDVTDSLTFTSQTAYSKDRVYSFQDFNRFNTQPIFTDTSGLTAMWISDYPDSELSGWAGMAPGGIFCDPQLGCSNTLAGFDISQADAEQFSQEFRLQSNFDGPLNFSAGANYTKFDVLVDYYVFYNLITAFALMDPFSPGTGMDWENCANTGFDFNGVPSPRSSPMAGCPYIDLNPIESIDGEGHNYFRSKNPYKLRSWAGFGEAYWQVADAVKITAGLRYTEDRKTFTPVPSQVLLSPSGIAGGTVAAGYPAKPDIKQKWGEWTGRLGVDWKPDLGFTDDTLLYAFYSRGYKGGGANPPRPGFATAPESRAIALANGTSPATIDFYEALGVIPVLTLTGNEYGDTFEPEFVDAYELGSKNTLLGGRLTLNTSAFFYDYKDYQVSQIRDRSAINENFDAKTWGLELESLFAATENLRIVFNVGYLDTKIARGEKSIDIMDRSQSNPNYVVVKPWVQLPSNCVVPRPVVEAYLSNNEGLPGYYHLCGGLGGIVGLSSRNATIDPATGVRYSPLAKDADGNLLYPELNGGAGLHADLGGNELPNAPHWTVNLGAQYSWDLFGGEWRATVRGDAYWQSQSWARVYNSDPYDKLRGWYNTNLSFWIEKPDEDLKIELYVKNALDDTPITDAFLNSDDTALTTNVFTLDPRLIGFSIRKGF